MKNKFLITTVLSFALFVCLNSVAQQPDFLFEHPYPYHLIHQLFYDERVEVVHLDIASDGKSEGCCFIAASDSKDPYCYETDSTAFMPIVYKVSPEGEVLGQLALGYEGRHSMVARLFEDPDDTKCCLAVGFAHDNDLHYDRPFMAKFDHELNLLWQKEIELPEPYRNTLNVAAIMDSGNDIVCCLAVAVPPVFCRLTTEGELVAINQPQYPCNEYINTCGNLFEYRDGSGDYGKVVEFYENYHTYRYLIRINTDFELVSNTPLPDQIHDSDPLHSLETTVSYTYVYSSLPMTDGSVILGASGLMSRLEYGHNLTNDDVVAFFRFGPDGNLVSYATVGQDELGAGHGSP